MAEEEPPYHIRPFPQQPHRGGKKLVTALVTLEDSLGEKVPDFEHMKALQAEIHEAANHYNDDRLIDRLRQLSLALDAYMAAPDKDHLTPLVEQILKARVDLKHL